MREIKFRGWHSKNNIMFSCEQMVKDQLTLLTDGSFINVNGNSTKLSVIYPNDKLIPLQYTGLKDDEDVEIYEGDIIEGSYGIPGRGIKGVVEYDGSAFIVKTPGHSPDETILQMLIEYIGQVWVRGNIYENPELIQEQE